MKLVDIEFEHSSNQLTIHAIRNEFIFAINEIHSELIKDLKKTVFLSFLKTGLQNIHPNLTEKQRELNSDIILNFLHYFELGWCVCKFDILQNIEVEERNETMAVSTAITQHFLHSVCKKWAEKLTKHFYLVNPKLKNLYSLDIAKHFPPRPWMFSFWKSISNWMKKYNLEEIDKEDNWLIKSVVYTVDYWAKNPSNISDVGILQTELNHEEYLETLKPPIELQEWQPQYKEREVYLNEVKQEAKGKLEQVDIFENRKVLKATLNKIIIEIEKHCNEVEKHFRSNGWKKVTVKKEYKKHIEWAIRFQIQKESFSSIARDYGVYPSSVKKEAESILKLIGLKKREAKRGKKRAKNVRNSQDT